jgi:hypothetical protein
MGITGYRMDKRHHSLRIFHFLDFLMAFFGQRALSLDMVDLSWTKSSLSSANCTSEDLMGGIDGDNEHR